MPTLGVDEYTTYEGFAEDWERSERETRMFWQLLDQLDDPNRDGWLDQKLREYRRGFEVRAGAVSLKTEWLPKPHVQMAAWRT